MSSKLEIGLIAVGAGAVMAGCYLLRQWCGSGRQNAPDVPTEIVPLPVAECRIEVDSLGKTEAPVEGKSLVANEDGRKENEREKNGRKKNRRNKKQKSIYKALEEYNLDVIINGRSITMTIDSGADYSVIKKSEWIKLGKPPLKPVPECYENGFYGQSGAKLHLKGQFTATIELYGRIFQLPVLVCGQSDNWNLLGRRWFPSLHLDWNSIFHCEINDGGHRFQKHSKKQDKTAMYINNGYDMEEFVIDLKLEGVETCMTLDTGAMHSLIPESYWEILGKPTLKPSEVQPYDLANRKLPLKGKCLVNVEYLGKKYVLPLLVTSGNTAYAVIGTDWFKYLRFNFNTIFQDIQLFEYLA